jgi:peptidoglycan/xylan/chitin deacetylase (PgdA/CDA1 family)
MRSILVPVCVVLAFVAATATARTAECPGNPDAIGTSRTIYVDPAEHARVGTMQYRESLPLNDHEVVLTFDDGPLPPKTTRILDILASECVKATFFSVGNMAQTYPAVLRREYAEGHSIGTHSQNHPLNFQRAPLAKVQQEVEDGIVSVTTALGDPKDVAPFFRIPGLLREDRVDDYINSRGLMIWSADFPADDWKHIRASEVYRRALMRIEARRKGVLLLHDIQPATVAALPPLLKELKRRGYHIVHVAPATAEQPKTTTEPTQWLISGKKQPVWTPEVVSVDSNVGTDAVKAGVEAAPSALTPPSPQEAALAQPFEPKTTRQEGRVHVIFMQGHIPLPPEPPRRRSVNAKPVITQETLPPVDPRSHVQAGVPAPRSDEGRDLTTGSVTSAKAAEPKPETKPSAADDEPILRPSAEIPLPKAPVASSGSPSKPLP